MCNKEPFSLNLQIPLLCSLLLALVGAVIDVSKVGEIQGCLNHMMMWSGGMLAYGAKGGEISAKKSATKVHVPKIAGKRKNTRLVKSGVFAGNTG